MKCASRSTRCEFVSFYRIISLLFLSVFPYFGQFETNDRLDLIFYYIENRQKQHRKCFLVINMSGLNACNALACEWPVTPSLVAYESFKVHPIYPSPFNAIVFTRVTCSKPCATGSSFWPPRSMEIFRCSIRFLLIF